MKKHRILALAGLATLGVAAPAAASPDVVLTPAAPEVKWAGPTATGFNTSWFADSLAGGGTCANTSEQTRCDSTLIEVKADRVASNAGLRIDMDGFRPTDDFDLRVYDLGTKPKSAGTYLGSPTGTTAGDASPLGSNDPRYTSAGDFEYKVVTGIKPGRFYRVDVVYFAVASGTYNGKVVATGLIDDPEPAQGA
jgi:hypothetical protein